MVTKVKRNGKGGRGIIFESIERDFFSYLIPRIFSTDRLRNIPNFSFRLEYLTLDRSYFFFFFSSNTSQHTVNAGMCNMVDIYDVNAIN